MLKLRECVWWIFLLLMLFMTVVTVILAKVYNSMIAMGTEQESIQDMGTLDEEGLAVSPFLLENSTIELQGSTSTSTIKRDTEVGFVLASHYSDQLTGGAINILCMQCWASTVSPHLKVVEPFISLGSHFGFELSRDALVNSTSGEFNLVRMRDVYELKSWEKYTSKKKFASLSSWEFFLKYKPRNLILVHTMLASRYNKLQRTFSISAEVFARRYNFTIVRNVIYKPKPYSPQQFKHMVYGKNSVSNSVVLFLSWGGILPKGTYFRIRMPGLNRCHRISASSGIVLRASQRIRLDGKKYTEKYLSSDGYISAMFRLQMYSIVHGFNEKALSDAKKVQMIMVCVNSIKKLVNILKRKYGVKYVFLAMDSGKHGSDTFIGNFSSFNMLSTEVVNNVSLALHHGLFGKESSLQEWEKSFDDITSFKTPGYVALLQKYLAQKGTCLLTAGGGTFQNTAMVLYKEKHKSSGVQCGKQVPKC